LQDLAFAIPAILSDLRFEAQAEEIIRTAGAVQAPSVAVSGI
jgi:hypothetical protein